MKYLEATLATRTEGNGLEILSIEQENSQYAVNLKALTAEQQKAFAGKVYIKATADKVENVVTNMHIAMTAADEASIDAILAKAGTAKVDHKVNGRLKEETLPRLALIPVYRQALANGMIVKFYGEPKANNPASFS